MWRNAEGATGPGPGLVADANGDQMVNGLDYAIWQSNYGATLAGSAEGVPEPATLVIALIAAFGAGWGRDVR